MLAINHFAGSGFWLTTLGGGDFSTGTLVFTPALTRSPLYCLPEGAQAVRFDVERLGEARTTQNHLKIIFARSSP